MIVGFIGTIGSGKTLGATKYLYEKYLEGKKIYSNNKFNFPHELITYEMMLNYANSEHTFNNSIIFIDEAHIFIDSRRSGSSGSILISYFLLQSRKKDVEVVWTSQFFNQIDIRLRNLTEVIISGKILKYCSCRKDCEHIKIQDSTIHIRLSVGEKIIKYKYVMNPYYKLYNTYEVVKNISVGKVKEKK